MNLVRSWRNVTATAIAFTLPLLASAAHAAEVIHEHGTPGHPGPETPLRWSSDLALWSIVVFLIFLGVLWKLAWKPMTEALDKREVRIREDILAVETARKSAEGMLAEHAARMSKVHDEVKEILAEARRDAEVAKANIIAAANAEAQASKTRAITEIERVKDQALQELFDHMANRVADATEHVLGHGLTAGDQDRLINEALNRFVVAK